jgi:hypothetical protein
VREHWSRLERNGKLGRAVAWSERMGFVRKRWEGKDGRVREGKGKRREKRVVNSNNKWGESEVLATHQKRKEEEEERGSKRGSKEARLLLLLQGGVGPSPAQRRRRRR